jgi:hypothetical protein
MDAENAGPHLDKKKGRMNRRRHTEYTLEQTL